MVNFCSEMTSFTRSPMERMPSSSLLAPSTGRWRTCFSVMRAMHSSTVSSRVTQLTLSLMISRTSVSLEALPMRMILRA